LATARDFGSGWKDLGEFGGVSNADPQGGCESLGLALGGGLTELADDVTHFSAGSSTAIALLNSHPTPEDAASTVAGDYPAYGKGADQCGVYTDSATGIVYDMHPLAVPTVGDGSFGVQVTATSGSSVREYDSIVFSRGNVVGAVYVTGAPADASLVVKVARLMLGRLHA